MVDVGQCIRLVEGLSSPDRNTRVKAQKVYDDIPNSNKFNMLIRIIVGNEANLDIKSFSAVICRSLIFANFTEIWSQCPEAARNEIREVLLQALQREGSESLRRPICQLISALATLAYESERFVWSQLVQFILGSAAGQREDMLFCSLQIISSFPLVFETCEEFFRAQIQGLFLQLFNSEHLQPLTKIEGIRALSNFLSASLPLAKEYSKFSAPLLNTVSSLVRLSQDPDKKSLEALISMIETIPEFFRPVICPMLQYFVQVVSVAFSDSQLQELSLEVLASLIEYCASTVRKRAPHLIKDSFLAVFLLMAQISLDPNWLTNDSAEEEDDSIDQSAAYAMERMLTAISPRVSFPVVTDIFNQNIQHNEWTRRYAAVTLVGALAHSCTSQLNGALPLVMKCLIPICADSHPRVRVAACNSLSVLCMTYEGHLQEDYADPIVRSMVGLLEDNTCPAIQVAAGVALVNFAQGASKQVMQAYLPLIFPTLYGTIQTKANQLTQDSTKTGVLQQMITTMAAVACASEEKFCEYYDVVQFLKYILYNAGASHFALLRCKTIECLSLIAVAVGSEKFLGDLEEVMKLFVKHSPIERLQPDDPLMSYVMPAWARFAEIFGERFSPFVHGIIRPVIEAASFQPELQVLSESESAALKNDSDWSLYQYDNGRSIGLKLTGLEDKATACRMICIYSKQAKEAFVCYIDQLVPSLVKNLSFLYNDDVRTASAESFQHILECSMKTDFPRYTKKMWDSIWPDMLDRLKREEDNSVLASLLISLSHCFLVLQRLSLSGEDMVGRLVAGLNYLYDRHFEAKDRLMMKRADEDYDEFVEEEIENMDEEASDVLDGIDEVVDALFSVYRQDFLPYFGYMRRQYTKLIGPDRSYLERHYGLCIWVNLIKYCGQQSGSFRADFIDAMKRGCCDPSSRVRQVSFYGFGLMAQNNPSLYRNDIFEVKDLILRAIFAEDAHSADNQFSTENAIAALVRIVRFCNIPEIFNADWVAAHILGWFPLYEDTCECELVYDYLCSLIETNNAHVLGPDSANLPKIVTVFLEAFKKEMFKDLTSNVGARCVAILKEIHKSPSMYALCVQSFSELDKAYLSRLIENQ